MKTEDQIKAELCEVLTKANDVMGCNDWDYDALMSANPELRDRLIDLEDELGI